MPTYTRNIHQLTNVTPATMNDYELGLALYHIGAKTLVSRDFTVDFIDKVVMRASQLLYTHVDYSKVNPCSEVAMDGPNERLRDDWNLGGSDWGDFPEQYVDGRGKPILRRVPEYKDGRLSQVVQQEHGSNCTCSSCHQTRLDWIRNN